MSSIPSFIVPSEVTLQSLRNELEGNIFPAVDGFTAKYFDSKSWSAAVQQKMQETESAEAISRLSADFLGLTHHDALVEWLAIFQSLIFTTDQTSFRFHSQPINKVDRPLKAAICLETSDMPAVAGSTRLFGEYHHNSVSVKAGDEDDTDFLSFCDRARQIFKNQPARCFLHAFLVRGTTLELWVFDRSGAYSSEKLDLVQKPHLLVQILAGYTMMSDEESGFNTIIKRLEPGSSTYVTFNEHGDKLYLQPELIASPSYLVGLGTTCYAASASATEDPYAVVKFSWRVSETSAELRQLRLARERNVWGVLELLGAQDLASIAHLRQGLQFPQPFVNRTFSCIATAPLGRPMQQFASIRELLEVLRDLVKALRSLYIDGRILHRDIAIKNVIINTSRRSVDSPMGVLIDFDQALDLDNARAVESMIGSDGFMAIGIFGQKHTYRHDLESLFYVFLWLAIGNDREHDDANDIMAGLPETSRLRQWCSMDFGAVRDAKMADMSPEGFVKIMEEFSDEFVGLKGLAEELHGLLFPVRDGKIFTGTDTEGGVAERLYREMADAFSRSALKF
ncbi:hypothetical protein ABW19_dt0201994 [Dactylella cylindrospora]|nr:hypothetical protein ABW19_dt0201994 [Dactylella cylindrospora]